jgi:hypothetical protein
VKDVRAPPHAALRTCMCTSSAEGCLLVAVIRKKKRGPLRPGSPRATAHATHLRSAPLRDWISLTDGNEEREREYAANMPRASMSSGPANAAMLAVRGKVCVARSRHRNTRACTAPCTSPAHPCIKGEKSAVASRVVSADWDETIKPRKEKRTRRNRKKEPQKCP